MIIKGWICLISLLALITSCKGTTIEKEFSLTRDVVSDLFITLGVILFICTVIFGLCLYIRLGQPKELNSYYQDMDEQHRQKLAGIHVPVYNEEGELVVHSVSIKIAPLTAMLMISHVCWGVPHSNQERNATHFKCGVGFFILGMACLVGFLVPMAIGFSVVNNVMYSTQLPNLVSNSFDLYYSKYIYACCLEVQNSFYSYDGDTIMKRSTSTYELNRLVRPLYCAFPLTDNAHNGTSYGNFIDQVRGRAQAVEYARTMCNAGAVIFVPDALETAVATGSTGFALGLLLFTFGTVLTFMGRNLSRDIAQQDSHKTVPDKPSTMVDIVAMDEQLPSSVPYHNFSETPSTNVVYYTNNPKMEQKLDQYCKE